MGGITPTYRCRNPFCPASFHFTLVCPRPARPAPMTEADERAWAEFRRLELEGDFDLSRTPSYMRERAEERAAASRTDPGHGWLLGFIPVLLLVGAVMVALMLFT